MSILTLNEKEGSKEKNIGQFSLLHEYGLPYVHYYNLCTNKDKHS